MNSALFFPGMKKKESDVAEFMIRFLICNIFISIMSGILLLAKHLLKNTLTSRMHYNSWFLLLGLLAVPSREPVQYCKLDERLQYIRQQKDTRGDWFDTVYPMVRWHFHDDCADYQINAPF